MPNINEILLKLEVFQYDKSPDLNMRYYHIQITEDTSNLCTIILPWGKYRYKCLTMGVSNSPEFFNRKLTIYSKYFNLSLSTYIPFWYS